MRQAARKRIYDFIKNARAYLEHHFNVRCLRVILNSKPSSSYWVRAQSEFVTALFLGKCEKTLHAQE